ncbi:hypothetical protein BGZ96_001558 [Linnemannia gamsii]|uniref:Extracellular membrane protein CFEM domain-containing protein n=1 Tax=Linnemannia gamsii TaxID=64522 RepID=A0ABQ7JME9_9FUNG|nr:hypothetical protein BGZ96_001558 [Linnemannia gamsii]
MRFSTSSSLIITLSTLTTLALAQNSTDPVISPACQDCLVNAGIAQVPTCTGANAWPKGNLALDTLTPDQKNCYCQLSSNDAWVKTCSAAEQCGADIVNGFVQTLVAVKPAVCPGAKSEGVRGVSGKVVGCVTVTAVVGALSALLL